MKFSRVLRMLICLSLALSITSCSTARKPAPKRSQKVAARVPRMNVSWEEVRRSPANVEVLLVKPTALAEGNAKEGWLRVPEQFRKFHTTIYMPEKPMLGVADYRVTKNGYLFVACSYDYQGNASGDWRETRWMRDDFYAHGWREATAADLGGALVDSGNREHVVFVKKVEAGESGRLRCNKYAPPLFIITSNESKQ